jgi:hypothetical protein
VAVPALVAVVLAQVLVLPPVRPHPQLRVLGQQLLADAALEGVALQLLNRQFFSVAMAGTTPKPRATYEPVPRSR